ncbi:MAG: methylated-DNA--[protein]-cysteine S-methyltransferase [Novosphingobium sp.]|nr:methylated-DNA--[protein]-cysteine S-methyltransferase [Novosphingobium sp.]
MDSAEQLERMQTAFAMRDRRADGQFVCAVRTTRIYCRPSCPARRPRPENVAFFATVKDARDAGYRPCLRCRPDDAGRDELAVAKVLQAIAATEERLTLESLAAIAGYSPQHLQRVFTRRVGLSPAAYARALRQRRADDASSDARSVTEAIYEAGFTAPSRFYDSMDGRMGMPASAWVNGGAGVTICWADVATTFGPMLVAATDKGVCRLAFGEDEIALRERFPNARLMAGGADFQALLQRVVSAVEKPGSDNTIPLDVQGTAFQEAVWRALQAIPAGETRTYAEIAAAAGNPRAVRAAGSANGANNVAVLIPCHRVVRSDGALGGYAYGTTIKSELLRREQEQMRGKS